MKRILQSILMAVAIAGPLASHLAAQDKTLVADIPFAFVSNHETLPAGRYNFVRTGQSNSVFQVRDARNGQGDFVMLSPSETGKPSTVTFACHGHDCVLAKITPAGDTLSYSLSHAAIERKLHYKVGFASMVSIKLKPR